VTRATLEPLARAALQNLEANRQRIDDLNVYPVPDGDTGSNLVLTLRRIVETIEESSADTPEELAEEIFHVALRAGKGNSGVIFSQIVRGFAKSLGQARSALPPSPPRSGREATPPIVR
jgi:fatty acid kinase